MFQVNEREEKFDMEEIGDGSTYSENHIGFLGTWKVKREEANEEFLKNLNNWTSGGEAWPEAYRVFSHLVKFFQWNPIF